MGPGHLVKRMGFQGGGSFQSDLGRETQGTWSSSRYCGVLSHLLPMQRQELGTAKEASVPPNPELVAG